MVEDYKIAVHEVETVQLVAGLLRIHDIFINHKSGALGFVVGPGANLTDGTKLAEEVKEGWGVDVVGEVLDEENAVGFRCQFV